MDPIANPFAPGAGSPPPELVGRGPILDQADILLGRVWQQKAEGLTPDGADRCGRHPSPGMNYARR